MQQPPGFEDARFPSHVCKLQRALYGLKQSPRAWYARLSARLLALGFASSKADTSLFFFRYRDVQIYMLVYVDDIVIAGSSPRAVDGLSCPRCQFSYQGPWAVGVFSWSGSVLQFMGDDIDSTEVCLGSFTPCEHGEL